MFEFTKDDLRSNQQGSISARQREWMEKQAASLRRSVGTTAWFVIAFLPIPILLILAVFMIGEGSRKLLVSAAPMLVIAFCFVIIVVSAFLFLSKLTTRKQAEEFVESQLLVTEGKAKIVKTFNPRWGSGQYLMLDEKKIMVHTGDIFEEGGHYRVYHGKTSVGEFILSHEKISHR